MTQRLNDVVEAARFYKELKEQAEEDFQKEVDEVILTQLEDNSVEFGQYAKLPPIESLDDAGRLYFKINGKEYKVDFDVKGTNFDERVNFAYKTISDQITAILLNSIPREYQGHF